MNEKPLPFLTLSRDAGGMLCTLNVAEFDEPACWGIVLSDIVQHLVNGYASRGLSPDMVRSRIVFMLSEELAKPTSRAHEVEGEWTADGFVPLLAGEGEA